MGMRPARDTGGVRTGRMSEWERRVRPDGAAGAISGMSAGAVGEGRPVGAGWAAPPPALTRRARGAVRAGVVPLLLAVALGWAAFRFLDAILHALDVFADYHAYYRAATTLRAGGDLYAEGRTLLERDSYDFWLGTAGQYVYPPLLAFLLVPLTALDSGKGGTVWLLVLVAATAAFLWTATAVLGRPPRPATVAPALLPALGLLPLLLGVRYDLVDPFLFRLALLFFLAHAAFALARAVARHRPPRPPLDPRSRAELATLAAAALPVLAAVPLLLGLRYGQIDVALLLLTTLALLAYLRGRDALAGVALGLAVAVKPGLALYALFFLRKRRWTTLGAAALTGLTLGLGPFLLLRDGAFADWYAIARYFTGDSYPTYPSNQSLHGFLQRAFVGGPRHAPILDAPHLAAALWLAGAGAALAGWCRLVSGRAARGPRDTVEYALTAVLMLFAAPLSEDVHYVALLLPLAVLAVRAVRGPASLGSVALAAAACLYFAQPWLDFAYNRGATDLRRLLASGAFLYGLLLVGAALVALLRVQRPAAGGAAGD